jgi:HlyD family secretion protein
MSKLKKTVLVLGALALVGAAVAFLRGRSAQQAPERELPVAAAERRDLEVMAEAAGLLSPIRVVEVKSKASGEVLNVAVETGSKVVKGALLAEIDPRDVQNALMQASADLESARVRLSTVEAQRARMETLRSSGFVTQQEYESAVDTAASARAAMVRAETNLQLARERRQDVTIRAPIDGTILERQIEPGQIIASATSNVSGGTTLFKMADLSEMQVRAKIDETDVGQIQPGMTVRVTLEAYPGRTFSGQVMKIEPQAVVEQNVTLFPVLIHMKNPAGLLKPGMNAEVSIEISSRQDVVTVPNTAVLGPREAPSVAPLLGLDEAAVRQTLRMARLSSLKEAGAEAGLSEECAELIKRFNPDAGPGNMTEAEREQLRQCMSPTRSGGEAEAPEGGGGQRRRGGGDPNKRPGVVFVQSPQGPQVRRVTLGLSDWEYTEITSGLEAGEKVLLVSVAQLQQQQQQTLDRVRQRAGGGVLPGGAGGGMRGGGGGGMRGGGSR